MGVRARALIGDLRVEQDRRRAEDMLRGAVFPWAEPGKQKVHPTTIARLLGCEHAQRLLREYGELPLFVDYVLSEIRARAAQASQGGKPVRTPIGMLIAAFGDQERRRTKPWVVPIWHRQQWERREAQRAEAQDVADRIRRLRDRHMLPERAEGWVSHGSQWA